MVKSSRPKAESYNFTLRVEDMTCGHCAGVIRTAIESALPGTLVNPDPATRLVLIGGGADILSIKAIIAAAGYTPTDTA